MPQEMQEQNCLEIAERRKAWMILGLILKQGLSINNNYIFVYSPKYVFEEKTDKLSFKKIPDPPK
ncbi:hypothetical protein WH96_18760 [Kiloniella spongiae]|uniref:Uncharacterized protein n=2 Tax=Kiloniella spongiae TaxID=1489064 RepID=A0A0H2M9J1_9PROT|nr:hypothetical protein WH96_18760 [Kiloniella spongiae]